MSGSCAFVYSSLAILCSALLLSAQSSTPASQSASANGAEQLQFVVILSRHGVRSPTSDVSQYNQYSAAPWPTWNVPPGYLTPHGFRLMQIFGSWDREQFGAEGLLVGKGCEDASHVTIYADTDQRTRETGRALAEGMFPACPIPIKGLTQGVNDPLFHPRNAKTTATDSQLAVSSIAGAIGGNPENIPAAYRSGLADLDAILSKCGTPVDASAKRKSLFDIQSRLAPGTGGEPIEIRGPLSIASTLTENLLLEYTEGMDEKNVGWGCVNGDNLRALIDLHTAESEIAQRPKPVARLVASAILQQIETELKQAASGKPQPGTIARPSDRLLILVGHDTNLATLSCLLDLHWIADGRRDDTPPGGALVFELWRSGSGEYSVRTFYTTQTLEQMRFESPLTHEDPPARAPIFIPGCSRPDLSCSLTSFERVAARALEGSQE